MNREIKFRAWDKKYFRMIDVNAMTWFSNKSPAGNQNIHIYDRSIDEFELMQFTGLKDKNGKEIYEGDVLSPNNREVQWRSEQGFDQGAGFYTLCHNPEYPFIPFSFGKTQSEDSEVIGNIYENPELIKTI